MTMATKKTGKDTSKKSKPKNNIEKVKEPEIVEATLFPDNPLLNAPVIAPKTELDQKIEIINEIESLSELSKQQLSIRRQKVEIEVEHKKLDTAIKTIDNVEKIIDAVSQTEVLDRVTKNIKKPLDMKLMTEAAEKLSNTLKNLMNPHMVDAIGTKKKQKINFMFRSSGTVQGVIQVDNSEDD